MSRRVVIVCLLIILLMAVGVRLYFFRATPNLFSAECEDYSKIHLMLQWAESPLWYPDTNFGPLHNMLLWMTYRLTGSLVTANRLMTLFFSLLLFLPVWRMTRRRLGDIEALGATAFFAWLFPLTVASVTTIAEVPFVCFMLLGLDLLDDLDHQISTSWWRLIGAAAALNAACAMRFEAWALLPVCVFYTLARRGFKEASVLAALLFVFPAAHMAESWARAGNPFGFLTTSAQAAELTTAGKSAWLRSLALPVALGKTIGWLGLALGLIGAAWAVRGRRLLLPVLCLGCLLALFEYKSINSSMDFDLLRYTALVNSLLALFVAVPVTRLARWRAQRWWLVALVSFLVVGAAADLTHANAQREIRLLEPTGEVFRLLSRLRPELKPGDRILIGSEYHPVIVVESGLRCSNFWRPPYVDGTHVDEAILAHVFTNWKPTLIIADRTEPLFRDVLKLPDAGEVELFGQRYRAIWSVARWNIWRLVEPAS